MYSPISKSNIYVIKYICFSIGSFSVTLRLSSIWTQIKRKWFIHVVTCSTFDTILDTLCLLMHWLIYQDTSAFPTIGIRYADSFFLNSKTYPMPLLQGIFNCDIQTYKAISLWEQKSYCYNMFYTSISKSRNKMRILQYWSAMSPYFPIQIT